MRVCCNCADAIFNLIRSNSGGGGQQGSSASQSGQSLPATGTAICTPTGASGPAAPPGDCTEALTASTSGLTVNSSATDALTGSAPGSASPTPNGSNSLPATGKPDSDSLLVSQHTRQAAQLQQLSSYKRAFTSNLYQPAAPASAKEPMHKPLTAPLTNGSQPELCSADKQGSRHSSWSDHGVASSSHVPGTAINRSFNEPLGAAAARPGAWEAFVAGAKSARASDSTTRSIRASDSTAGSLDTNQHRVSAGSCRRVSAGSWQQRDVGVLGAISSGGGSTGSPGHSGSGEAADRGVMAECFKIVPGAPGTNEAMESITLIKYTALKQQVGGWTTDTCVLQCLGYCVLLALSCMFIDKMTMVRAAIFIHGVDFKLSISYAIPCPAAAALLGNSTCATAWRKSICVAWGQKPH